MIVKQLAIAALLVAGGGCSTVDWCGIRTYRPLVVSAPGSPYVLFEAARRAALSLGPSHLEVAERELSLSALVDERDTTREHVRIAVSQRGDLSVDVRTELEGSDGRWIAPGTVCDEYSHARERIIADRILNAVVPSL